MGTSYKGDSPTFRSVGENLSSVSKSFSYVNGRFGILSPSTGNNTRNIFSKDPLRTATDFYNQLAYGGIENFYENGNRKITEMADGTIVTWRKTSKSDGTLVVEINIKGSSNNSGLKNQKIHFVEEQ